MEKTLAIIGAGRVGRMLGRGLRELGWKIGAVVTRGEASARRAVRFIGAGKADLDALLGSPKEFAHAYEALSLLAARVLAQDRAGLLAELEKNSVEEKLKTKVIGGNA
ncbi:MAG: hypothetical protein DMG49_08320 [Acidobacteria bacterium]|nr:MAG: hypothetical protein DMG49_08320 [Acidobacteriota bacterium]